MTIEPIPEDCFPSPEIIEQLLRGPKVDADGKIIDGVYAGLTWAEVAAQREAFRRIVGE